MEAAGFPTSRDLRRGEPCATWRKLPDQPPINPFANPKSIRAVVVGAKTHGFSFFQKCRF